MMSETAVFGEGHADDIFQADTYEAAMPSHVKRDFLPWHRPRKQYVRHHQWRHEVIRLFKEYPPIENTLKYFGLPGLDLLDLRYFHDAVCLEQGLKLRFLGFNTSARPDSSTQTEMNISLDEVKRLRDVDPMSEVIGDSFALVAKSQSIASKKMHQLGPYDVINLDLCDGFGAHEPGGLASNNYEAVSSILGRQTGNDHPWLLFLTTRADRGNINAEVLRLFIGKYCANLGASTQFRDASRDLFDIETAAAVSQAADNAEGLLHVFLTGLCKWFVGLALAHNPPISVEVRSVFSYRVDRGAEIEDLVSVAFQFTPTFCAIGDPLGLAVQPATKLDEGVLAARAIRRVAKRIDADKKLKEDSELLQKMTDATAHLLGLARYDIDEYKVWAAKP